MGSKSDAQRAALIEQATVDCYNEDEQVTGFFTMIEENLEVPFKTVVLGIDVTVERIDLTIEGGIVALCRRGVARQVIAILELPLSTPPPPGAEWIDACRHWCR
jgi:hypothetical protein